MDQLASPREGPREDTIRPSCLTTLHITSPWAYVKKTPTAEAVVVGSKTSAGKNILKFGASYRPLYPCLNNGLRTEMRISSPYPPFRLKSYLSSLSQRESDPTPGRPPYALSNPTAQILLEEGSEEKIPRGK